MDEGQVFTLSPSHALLDRQRRHFPHFYYLYVYLPYAPFIYLYILYSLPLNQCQEWYVFTFTLTFSQIQPSALLCYGTQLEATY